MDRTVHNLIPLLLLALLAACVGPGGIGAGTVLRSIDNDTFARSDDHYTAGLSLSHVGPPVARFEDAALPGAVARTLDQRWPFEGDQRFVLHSISQRMFTPTDLEATSPVPGDLPYSALLYGTTTVGSQTRERLDAVSLTLGVVGPLALGEELQTAWHDMIGAEDPAGWDRQLDTELLLNVGYDHRRRIRRFGNQDALGGDLLGAVSLAAGNLQSRVSLAVTGRLGLAVPDNFHMQAPFLAEESLGLRATGPRPRRSIYAFAGLDSTWLYNAIYLDGNTFEDSHSVEHEDHLWRGSLGVAAQFEHWLATITYERSEVAWDHPEGLGEEAFVRLGVTWNF